MLVSDLDGVKVNTTSFGEVLILVLVDVGLGQNDTFRHVIADSGLNPCFSGCWSRTLCQEYTDFLGLRVLILVLVDVGLGLLISS